MRIGLGLPPSWGSLAEGVQQFQRAEQAGFAFAGTGTVRTFDGLTVLAVAGQVTERIELVAGVVPTYPRHPAALAQQALTVQAATGGRLVLGIGPSHPSMIEEWFGLPYASPVAHTREYLTVLNGLLGGTPTPFTGKHYQTAMPLQVPGAARPAVFLSALGPQMLRLCGELADGTITAYTGLPYVRDVIVPTLTQAAAQTGRPTPRVMVFLPVCVTDAVEAVRDIINTLSAWATAMPSYQRTLAHSGAAAPADIALVGQEDAVAEQLGAYAAAGVTDFCAMVIPEPGGSDARTYEFLRQRAIAPARS